MEEALCASRYDEVAASAIAAIIATRYFISFEPAPS
jgi:hypothetical protein